ncbi:hypothetical protein Tco_0421645 [Tanacetum coccineum]
MKEKNRTLIEAARTMLWDSKLTRPCRGQKQLVLSCLCSKQGPKVRTASDLQGEYFRLCRGLVSSRTKHYKRHILQSKRITGKQQLIPGSCMFVGVNATRFLLVVLNQAAGWLCCSYLTHLLLWLYCNADDTPLLLPLTHLGSSEKFYQDFPLFRPYAISISFIFRDGRAFTPSSYYWAHFLNESTYVVTLCGFSCVKALYGSLHQAPRDGLDLVMMRLMVLMKGEFEMSAMGELTFFLGLQVKQQPDGIFISQDKYVQDMLMRFDMESVETGNTLPMKLASLNPRQ